MKKNDRPSDLDNLIQSKHLITQALLILTKERHYTELQSLIAVLQSLDDKYKAAEQKHKETDKFLKNNVGDGI